MEKFILVYGPQDTPVVNAEYRTRAKADAALADRKDNGQAFDGERVKLLLVVPYIGWTYGQSVAEHPKKRPCLICGRQISTYGSAPGSHAETHVRSGELEEIRRNESLVGYRTPGTPGYYTVWTDQTGAERACYESAYPTAAEALKATEYQMGREKEKRAKALDDVVP